jgi:outer membrane lipoprotein-sorting protein
MRLLLRVCGIVGLALAAGCARAALTLPSGRGAPLADPQAVHGDVARACGGVKTMTAELALSGRAASQRVTGRAVFGFEAPDALRLEGVAPFGQPAFILVARRGEATLLLPRDGRVLKEAAPDDILGALTGVALAPADLQAILTGCVVPGARAASGWEQGGWVVLELQPGGTLYLRRTRDGALQLRAARRDSWQIEYADWQGDFPRTVRLVSAAQPAVDLTARLSQLETNVDLDGAAFTVDVPDDSLPISLEELRDAGPLRASS